MHNRQNTITQIHKKVYLTIIPQNRVIHELIVEKALLKQLSAMVDKIE